MCFVVVPNTVCVIRTTFCQNDTQTHKLKTIPIPITVMAGKKGWEIGIVMGICLKSAPNLRLDWNYPLFTFLLSLSYQGKISKSVSMNCGPCQGMALGLKLSHSDSYTWAMENRRPSKSIHRDGSISSLGSQDMSFSELYQENCIHTESQVRKIPIVNQR